MEELAKRRLGSFWERSEGALDEDEEEVDCPRVRLPASFRRSCSINGIVNAKFPPALKPERANRRGSRRSSSA